ncbi:MAG: hypothetical protein HKN93_05125 [Acidimicrobiia bacterium]|nr:hypothetical protein [Acidimicrobiia bacterium]
MAPDEPTNGPDEPLSSEDLLRQARENLSRPETDLPPTDPVGVDSEAMVDAGEAAAEAPPAVEDDPEFEMLSAYESTAVETPDVGDADPFGAGEVPPRADSPRPATVTDRMATPSQTTPSQTAPPEQPSPLSRIWQSRGILIGLVIVGLIVFRFFDTSTSVDNLTVGDCFNEPSANEFDAVDVIDCDDEHDYEVLATVALPGGDYPGDFEVTIEAFERCEALFEQYVGVSFDASEVYIAPFVPAEASWEDGQQEALCGLYLLAGDQESVAKTTGSLRGTGR